MNINRDYLIILDVKSGEVDSPNIYYFNTDKNTSNLYVQMVIKETSIEAAPIDNANNYSIKANILKPNMVGKIVEGDLVNESKAIYEFKLPADCTDFSGNAKIEFEVYCTVDGVEEIATSFATKFKVHGSVLTEQNKYIEDSSDYPILKELMAEVKVINETAHELDTTIRTLQSDMIEANNEMKTNEATRQANETTRVANEATRIAQENAREEYFNAFDGKWEEYKAGTDADIANYKAQINAQEVAREQAEATREANEQQRIANENARKTAENNRVANESVRATNEAERKANEASRVSAENARTNAEEIRQTNEANREASEAIRRTNEEARITAETARVTEHEAMKTELNEVKAENAILMENDKKVSDRMTQVEISDKRQYVIMEGLMNSAGDGYLKIEDTGNDTTLYNSVEGFVDVKNITGNTMVNSIKNPDDEFTLNADINTSGQSVTLTTAVDNGQVDVLAEGNTMVNVCDQKDPVAITTDTNTFPLRYLYTSTEYTLQFESDTAVTIDITLGGYTLSSQNIVIGLNKINIITPNELTDNNLILNGTGFNASNIVVTEATDKDFGYFAGMKSVGELEENKIEILSTNGNLADINTAGSINFEIGHIKRGKTYSLSVVRENNIGYNLKLNNTSGANIKSGNYSNFVTFTSNYDGILFYNGYSTDTITDIMLVEGKYTANTMPAYVPHANNKKQILLNEPLRAVGDTKDRFVQIDGKWYVEKNCAERNYETDDETNTSYKTDKVKTVYTLPSPTYEPVEIAPTVNTYTDVTHITNNSTIPMNMPIVNSGYEVIAKPSTKYTVVGIDSGRIGDSTIVNGTITTPATITDNFLRPYGTGKTSKVMLLEGEPANIPGYFKGIKSVFEDKVTEDGKYAVEVKVVGKNKFSILDTPWLNNGNMSIVNFDTNSITLRTSSRNNWQFAKVKLNNIKPNTDYKFSFSVEGNTNLFARVYNGNNPIDLYPEGNKNIRLFNSGNCEDLYIRFFITLGDYTNIQSKYYNIQLEEGIVASEYEPYHETKQTLYLDEPLYNANNITIYNDKLGYWKNWDKVVLDGSEVEEWYKIYLENRKLTTLFYMIFDAKKISDYNSFSKVYCNNFSSPDTSLNYYDCEGCYTAYDGNICISINNSKLKTLDVAGLKQYLSENPLTVVYQLAEPEFIPLIDNCPNFVIGSWDNCSIHFDSIIPLKDTRYRYTGNVPSVVAMSDEVATNSAVSDEQDNLIVDLATQVAVLEMMTL